MLENTEKITGIKGMGKDYDRIYLNAEEFGACIYTSRYALYDGYKTGSENGEPVAPLMGNIKDYDGGTGDFPDGTTKLYAELSRSLHSLQVHSAKHNFY